MALNATKQVRGGGNTLSINVDTGILVTITNGDIQKQATSQNGVALFKNIKAGTWNVQATLSGQETSGQIVINDDYSLSLSYGVGLITLPIKDTKILVNGDPYIYFAKDHSGYPSGALTLFAERVLTTMIYGNSPDYLSSNVRSWLVNYYNELPTNIREKILPTTISLNHWNSPTATTSVENIFILSTRETGGDYTSDNSSNIGFTNNAERTKLNAQGVKTQWFTRTNLATSNYRIAVVTTEGLTMNGGVPQYSSLATQNGVVPAFNIDPSTLVKPSSTEGYYEIV